jgi:cobalt-zinc-cadmium efflux system membrane fusion protein
LLFFQACGDPTPQQDPVSQDEEETSLTLTNAQFQSAGIRLGHTEQRDISTVLRLNGKIDVPPQNMVSVSTPFGGFLKSTQLLPGMRIKKGEIIATMEDQQYIQLQQDFLTAKSKLKFLESEYNRQKDLNQSKASSDKILQQTEMEFNTQKIILSSLAQKLKLINVDPETLNENNLSRSIQMYSTIDGFVSHVNVNIGKYLNPSDILFELINPEDIHLNLKVFEKDLPLLAIGQKLLAYNNNTPNKKYPCEIILIGQDLAAERSTEVHCHFVDYDKSLFPGMYMNAEIEIKIKNVPSIPDDAIVNYQGKDYIFISKGKMNFEMLEITKGSSENNYTEVTTIDNKDLSKSTVVTKGAYSLLMQLKNKSE